MIAQMKDEFLGDMTIAKSVYVISTLIWAMICI